MECTMMLGDISFILYLAENSCFIVCFCLGDSESAETNFQGLGKIVELRTPLLLPTAWKSLTFSDI